jgi:hypothetical protein
MVYPRHDVTVRGSRSLDTWDGLGFLIVASRGEPANAGRCVLLLGSGSGQQNNYALIAIHILTWREIRPKFTCDSSYESSLAVMASASQSPSASALECCRANSERSCTLNVGSSSEIISRSGGVCDAKAAKDIGLQGSVRDVTVRFTLL